MGDEWAAGPPNEGGPVAAQGPRDPLLEGGAPSTWPIALPHWQREIRRWAEAKGWRGPGAPERTFGEEIALLHSEVSEALEAFRKYPEAIPSELADVFIRLCDMATEHGVDLQRAVAKKMVVNWMRPHRHGGLPL